VKPPWQILWYWEDFACRKKARRGAGKGLQRANGLAERRKKARRFFAAGLGFSAGCQ
jgi:hypothetical protein